LNFTDVAPVNPVPLTVTLVPTGPLVGEKLLIVGADVLSRVSISARPIFVVVELTPVIVTRTLLVVFVANLTDRGEPSFGSAPSGMTEPSPKLRLNAVI
jgi:hypothetical protein